MAKGVPFKCLPLDFMGFYVLSGLETDKKLKEMSKRYLLTDIAKRRECIKALSISGGINIKTYTLYHPTLRKFSRNWCPEYHIFFLF